MAAHTRDTPAPQNHKSNDLKKVMSTVILGERRVSPFELQAVAFLGTPIELDGAALAKLGAQDGQERKSSGEKGGAKKKAQGGAPATKAALLAPTEVPVRAPPRLASASVCLKRGRCWWSAWWASSRGG